MTFGMNRRAAVACVAAGFATAISPIAFAADAWPAKTLRIIVPFAPGGAADSSARVLGEVIGPQLGQTVIIENKPGAGSAIGVVAAAQSKDGHTLLMGSNSMVINPSSNPQVGYNVARDFEPVGMVSAQPLVLVVPANSSIKSVPDLIVLAKAKPGTLTAGNSGKGTLAHITAEIFASETGIDTTPVPYKGESALMPDLIGGLVSFGFLNLPSVVTHTKSGRLRALAVSSAQPIADLPNVPTLRSLNYPSLEVEGWAALLAPKGSIPPEGMAKLEALLAKALASDTVKTRFAAIGVMPTVMNRQATAQFLQAEAFRYAAVIKARNIKAD